MINKCPVCDQTDNVGKQQCSRCGWYLSPYTQNKGMRGISQSTINDEDFRKVESWARNAWKRLIRYRAERDNYKQELQNYREHITSHLITKIDYLTEQLPSLSNLDHHLSSIVQQSLETFDFDHKLTQLEESILEKLSSQKPDHFSLPNDSEIKISPIQEVEKIEEVNQFVENINSENIENLEAEITPKERSLIDTYYNNPQYLMQYIYKVVPTKQTVEDIYLNKANEIIFQPSNQSDYWIIKLRSGTYYLLPDLNLKVNTNIKTIRMIFNLQNYIEHESKNYTLIKSAKVFSQNETDWKLIEKGILQF